jgi:superfamily II DNA or RNA helicase
MRIRIGAMAEIEDLPVQGALDLKDDLTFTIEPVEGFGDPGEPEEMEAWDYAGGVYRVPRQYARRLSDEWEDQTVHARPMGFGFNGHLRAHQIPWVEEATRGLQENGLGGLLLAPCGWGKTVATLDIVADLGGPVLILVHRGPLFEQWYREAERFLGVTPGKVQEATCEFEGRKVAVAMVQSLISREYPEAFYKWPGVVVADEVHRHGAPKWHRAMMKFPAQYRIGLTATPRRRDGLEDVFRYHVGPILTKGHIGNLKPKVFRIFTGTSFPDEKYRRKFKGSPTKKLDRAWLVKAISLNVQRNTRIVLELGAALRGGRKVLALSDRIDHLSKLKNWFDRGYPEAWESAYFTGQVPVSPGAKKRRLLTPEEREKAAEADVIFASYQMAKEGVDIPALDTLFLLTPKGDVEQAIGRILRDVPGKKEPLVVDFVDEGATVKGMSFGRARQYQRLGYEFQDRT